MRESGESRSGIMSLLVSFKKKPKIGRGTLLGHPRGQL